MCALIARKIKLLTLEGEARRRRRGCMCLVPLHIRRIRNSTHTHSREQTRHMTNSGGGNLSLCPIRGGTKNSSPRYVCVCDWVKSFLRALSRRRERGDIFFYDFYRERDPTPSSVVVVVATLHIWRSFLTLSGRIFSAYLDVACVCVCFRRRFSTYTLITDRQTHPPTTLMAH